MTTPRLSRSPAAGVEHPPTALLHGLRPIAQWLLRRRYDVAVHGAAEVPREGPVVLACSHTGFLDGPLLAIYAPRPVHAWTKAEMFRGRLGAFLAASGQIELDRLHPDPRAVKQALRVLEDGDVVGVFPEGTRGAGDFTTMRGGAAYLALATGAPVVPVVQFGVREPGASSRSLPAAGGRVDIVFGTPWRVAAVPFPRGRARVYDASLSLQRHLRAHLDHARRVTGRELPGPLPAGDTENRPGLEAAEGATP